MNLFWIPLRPREEQSHEVAPAGMAHTTPTVVSAAVTVLLKMIVGHLVVTFN